MQSSHVNCDGDEAQVQNLDTNYDVKAWVKHKCKTQG